MENYEEFIRRRMSQITNNSERFEQAVIQWSSKIRFYGFPILPPLLNKDQKEEMQRLREASARVTRKKMCSMSRMSCVQAFLDSVEVRKAPTLEEFKNDTGPAPFTSTSSTECHRFYICGRKDDCNETKESHWNSTQSTIFSPVQNMSSENVQISPSLPLASTACDGLTTLDLRPFQAEGSYQSSHKTVMFEDLDAGYGHDSQVLPHSVKHSLTDVSHQALSSGYVTNETSYVNSSLVDGTAITTVGSEGRPLDCGGFFLKSSNVTNKVSDIISHAPVDGEALEEESAAAESQALTRDAVVQPGLPKVEADPPDEPYRMSLQNLLKKSQEHRRRQRLLRNQAKVQKTCETSERHSLSDKENEEALPVGAGRAELRRNRENRKDQGNRPLDLKISSQGDQTCSQIAGKEIIGSTKLVSHVDVAGASKVEISLDPCLNVSPSSNTKSSMTGKALPPASNHPNTTTHSPPQSRPVASTSAKCLYQSKGKKTGSMLPRPCVTVGKKFKNVPTPKFCLSPVRSKKGSGVSSPARKPRVKTPVCVDEAGSGPCGLDRDGAKSVLMGAEEIRPLNSSVHQAEQIAQIELNLSSLKLLISDLESTLESQTNVPPETVAANDCSRRTALTAHGGVGPPAGGGKPQSMVIFSKTLQKGVAGEDCGTQRGSKERVVPYCVTSLLQKMRVPEVFRTVDDSKQRSQRGPVLNDSSNQSEDRKVGFKTTEGSLSGSYLNRSYDVDTPSGLLLQAGSSEKQLTPELGGQEGMSRAKRRLLMNTEEDNRSGQDRDEGRPQSSTPKTPESRKAHGPQVPDLQQEHRQLQELRKAHGPQVPDLQQEHRQLQELRKAHGPQVPDLQEEHRQQQELRKTHGPQVPDLQQEHRQQQELRKTHGPQVPDLQEDHRQQQELLQSLAARYQFLRSVSFPCSAVGSRLEDAVTSAPPASVPACLSSSPHRGETVRPEPTALSGSCGVSRSPSCLPVCYRPLVAAAVKGYLTRRLLRTEKAAQLIRTIKDTQVFLQGFQAQTPGREYSSRQDQVLQERVTLQLRSARFELHDLFFSLSPAERIQVIVWDRQLTRERRRRQQENEAGPTRGKGALSTATRKALERKKTGRLPKKVAERAKMAAEDGRTFVPNSRRLPKKPVPSGRPR